MGIPAMTKCCNQLDMCYDTCGSNKYRCDSKFRWCLHSICAELKKSLGFVSKVEGRFHLNLFVVDISQKQWKRFTSQWGGVSLDELNSWLSRKRCLNQLFGATDGNGDVSDTLEMNRSSVSPISEWLICFFESKERPFNCGNQTSDGKGCFSSVCFCLFFPACETVADTLFNTVWTLGCRPYMNSQRAACYCQGEEKDEL